MQAKWWFNEFKVTFSDKSVVYAGIDAIIPGVRCRTIKMKIEIKFKESQIELYFLLSWYSAEFMQWTFKYTLSNGNIINYKKL